MTAATTRATSSDAIRDVGPCPIREPDGAAVGDGARGERREQRAIQEDGRADVDDREPGPVEHLLREPVQPLVARLVHVQRVHLGHGHLGDGDERIQVTDGASHRRDGRGGLEEGGRHADAEEHPRPTEAIPRDRGL
jgi:hypothetical protein